MRRHAAVLERRGRADAPVNDGLFVRRDVRRNPYGLRRRGPEVHPMNIRITITMKVEITVALTGLAVVLWLLS
jgi:hypothetical protein